MGIKPRLARSRHHHRALTPNEAVLAEWTRLGKDCRRLMLNHPKIDKETEMKAELFLRQQDEEATK